jgi:hypothetical protein
MTRNGSCRVEDEVALANATTIFHQTSLNGTQLELLKNAEGH